MTIKSNIQNPYIASGYLLGLSEKVAPAALISMFDNDSDKLSVTLNGGDYVGTGSIVKLTIDGTVKDFVTVIVLGDIDGDGTVSSVDYLRIKRNFSNLLEFSTNEFKAADVDADGKITSTDYLKIKKHMSGAINLYE